MFKATVVASKLREQIARYFDLVQGNDVIQIIHRGGDIKVLMTQEHYLSLLSRLALYEKSPNAKTVPSKSSQEIENAIRAKMKAHEKDREQENEHQNDTRRMGQRRAR